MLKAHTQYSTLNIVYLVSYYDHLNFIVDILTLDYLLLYTPVIM